MLTYSHVYNQDIKYPYNIACINSDSTNVAIYVNSNLQEIASPNVSYTDKILFTTNKKQLSDQEVLDLIYSGTLQDYTLELNRVIFGPTNKVFIKRQSDDKFLYLSPEKILSWEETFKSRFFFNPYYFDSDYLWKKLFKQRPDNVNTTSLWNVLEEQRLFNRSEIVLNVSELPNLVEPTNMDYFSGNSPTSISLSHVIELKASIGDTIDLKTDKDTLSFTYNPTPGSRMIVPNISGTTCTRPWIHIPLRVLDPNKEILYTKILNRGINNFTIRVEEDGNVFTKSLTITR